MRFEDYILFQFFTFSIGILYSSSSDVYRDVDKESGVNGALLFIGRARAAAGI
jgi:hypothetical protein